MNVLIIHTIEWHERGWQLWTKTGNTFNHFHDTLCRTLEECKELCRENGYNITGIYNDIWQAP